MPPLDLTVIAGTGSAKLEELKGKVVIIEIWASSCPPCVSGLSDIKQLIQQFPELQVIAVSSNQADVIRAQAEALGSPFTFASDPNRTIGKHLGAYMYPLTILIDRTGIIRYIELGKYIPSPLSNYVSLLMP
jgi:peroxiredoxin